MVCIVASIASEVTFAASRREASALARLPTCVEWPLMGMSKFRSELMYPVYPGE